MTWEGTKDDGFASEGQEAQVVRTAVGPGSNTEHGQGGGDVPRSPDTEGEWECVQCGQGTAQDTDTCDACGAEAAFVDVVMQSAMPSSSGACLGHEPTAGNTGQSAKCEFPESQDPRAFLTILGRVNVNELSHRQLHCPTEVGVEGAEDCEVLVQVQRHGAAPNGAHLGPLSCPRRSRGQE